MRKLISFFIVLIAFASVAKAIVIFDANKDRPKSYITVTSLYDFAPISFVEGKSYKTVLEPYLEKIYQGGNFVAEYNIEKEHAKNILSVEDLKAQLFVGCFADSYDYRNFKLVYPAAITTPVSLITLPSSKISKIAELRGLKAGVYKNEPYPDFIKTQINEAYNAKNYDSYDDMFMALFNKEIDYIFTNYYYGIVKIAEHGLGAELALSKQSLWAVPMFLCINPKAKDAELIYSFASKYIQEPELKESVKNNLIKMINDVKTKYRNVSAPAYVIKGEE